MPSTSRRELVIAPDLALPIDAVTETFAILGKRGSGKTTTARVLTEELLDAGQPVVVLDPTGVWWGLRSSADGKAAGYAVVIFGGDHADVPLTETSGSVVADVVVDDRVPAVLDLSRLTKSAQRRFVTEFLERLYHRNRDPLHVVVDEADLFAPQRVPSGAERLLGAMNDLVRRGRVRGLGTTLITQRPAVLNKDVLTQAEVMVALRLIGARDRAAIDDWIETQADQVDAKEVITSLPGLAVGTAWVWSPGWLEILRKVSIRAPRTYDSSATPKAGQRTVAPQRMAVVDLERLRERIADTVERAEADSPTALRRRIAALERELAAANAKRANTPPPEVVRVEVPVLSAEDLAELWRMSETAQGWAQQATQAVSEVAERISEATSRVVSTVAAPVPSAAATRQSPPPAPPARRSSAATVPASPAGDTNLGKAERAILTVLAQHGRRSTTQVAIIAGYSHKSGGYRNSLSKLRTAGLIDGRGDIEITPSGVESLGVFDPLPTGADLREWWGANQLGRAERAILDVLAAAYPDPVDVPTISAATGYSATSGGFRNALSRLRSLELASGRGALVMSDALA